MKSKEECAICLCEMHCGDGRIQLTCGHYFHKECLGKMMHPICPLCRAPISIKKCLDIFPDSRIENIVMETLSTPIPIQNAVVDSFELINGISYIQNGAFVNIVNNLLHATSRGCEDTDHRGPEMVLKIVNLFSLAMTHMKTNRTLTGFVAAFDDDEVLHTSAV